MKPLHYISLTLISVLAFSCKEEAPPQVTTTFCDSIHRNDSISLSTELKSMEEKRLVKLEFMF